MATMATPSSVTYPVGGVFSVSKSFGLPGEDLACSIVGGRTMVALSSLLLFEGVVLQDLYTLPLPLPEFLTCGDVCVVTPHFPKIVPCKILFS
jgi:hypothetical protein